MADDEQFSLCWNNFNSNLSAGFHESLCRGDLVDVTLAAEGQFVKAHRLVLSVCSPYFRRMFTQMPANQHAFVFLKDVSHSALKDLIQFMYCGEVNVKQDALPAFISTAEALQIKGLTDGEPAPSQSPAKPSTPAPQSTIPAPTMTTTTTTTSPRARSSNQRNRSSYKLESEDSGDENKPTNQLVLSTQSQQHTLVQQLTQKRPAQRSITPHTTPIVKRIKNSDPLEGTEPTQITVQTVVDNKSNSGEAEFIDLPIDLPTKSEPDYTEDAGDVETAEQETTYVEDDSYGDMKYDESYFTENDETATAPTTSATVKQSASFSESYVSDTGDQATTEAQDATTSKTTGKAANFEELRKKVKIVRKSVTTTVSPQKNQQSLINQLSLIKPTFTSTPDKILTPVRPSRSYTAPLYSRGSALDALSSKKPVTLAKTMEKIAPENIICKGSDGHMLILLRRARLKGFCVECIKMNPNFNYKDKQLKKICTYCPLCPGGNWMCEECFKSKHTDDPLILKAE